MDGAADQERLVAQLKAVGDASMSLVVKGFPQCVVNVKSSQANSGIDEHSEGLIRGIRLLLVSAGEVNEKSNQTLNEVGAILVPGQRSRRASALNIQVAPDILNRDRHAAAVVAMLNCALNLPNLNHRVAARRYDAAHHIGNPNRLGRSGKPQELRGSLRGSSV